MRGCLLASATHQEHFQAQQEIAEALLIELAFSLACVSDIELNKLILYRTDSNLLPREAEFVPFCWTEGVALLSSSP